MGIGPNPSPGVVFRVRVPGGGLGADMADPPTRAPARDVTAVASVTVIVTDGAERAATSARGSSSEPRRARAGGAGAALPHRRRALARRRPAGTGGGRCDGRRRRACGRPSLRASVVAMPAVVTALGYEAPAAAAMSWVRACLMHDPCEEASAFCGIPLLRRDLRRLSAPARRHQLRGGTAVTSLALAAPAGACACMQPLWEPTARQLGSCGRRGKDEAHDGRGVQVGSPGERAASSHPSATSQRRVASAHGLPVETLWLCAPVWPAMLSTLAGCHQPVHTTCARPCSFSQYVHTLPARNNGVRVEADIRIKEEIAQWRRHRRPSSSTRSTM
eukprot:scaffold6501_cov323-Prasinococcus_capsulatus_cf.AAC.1